MKRLFKYAVFICIMILAVLTFTGCEGAFLENILPSKAIKGNGVITSNIYKLSDSIYSLDINEINFLYKAGILEIDEKLADSIVISSDQNILDMLSVDVSSSKITVTVSGEESYRYNPTQFKITIGVPISDMLIDGAFDVDVDISSVTKLNITSTGILNGEMNIGEVSEFNYVCTGKDSIKFYGRADMCNVTIKGVSQIDAINLVTRKTNIMLYGASSYTAYVTEELKAELNGLATLKYAGAPERIIPVINGLGSIKEIEG